MARIQCFLLEPTGFMAITLRRYSLASASCPSSGRFHNVHVFIEREPEERDDQGIITNTLKHVAHDDPRWPTHCDCGYQFTEKDEWQRFASSFFRRTDTGEEMTINDAPVGAMWYATWLDWAHTSQDETGHPLVVKTPGGDWVIDAQCSNCTMPDDTRQERHHCWVRHGKAPVITVDKAGVTCGAGAGSIQCGSYHGFLRNGYLED